MKKIVMMLLVISLFSLLLPPPSVYAQDPPEEKVVCCILCEYSAKDSKIEITRTDTDGFPLEFRDATDYSALYQGCTVCEECPEKTVEIDCPCPSEWPGYCRIKAQHSKFDPSTPTYELSPDGFFRIYKVECTTTVEFDICPLHTFPPFTQYFCFRNCSALKAAADKASVDAVEICTWCDEIKKERDRKAAEVKAANDYLLLKQGELDKCSAEIDEQIRKIEREISDLEWKIKDATEGLDELEAEINSKAIEIQEMARSMGIDFGLDIARHGAIEVVKEIAKVFAKRLVKAAGAAGWFAAGFGILLTLQERLHFEDLLEEYDEAMERLTDAIGNRDSLEDDLAERQEYLRQQQAERESGCVGQRISVETAKEMYVKVKSELDRLDQELAEQKKKCDEANAKEQEAKVKYEECLKAQPPSVCK